jgi:ssRNA-specific RNase YbeY (16S rRNA maturation enzyme)
MLHLIGYDHESDDAQALAMEAKTAELLRLLDRPNPAGTANP